MQNSDSTPSDLLLECTSAAGEPSGRLRCQLLRRSATRIRLRLLDRPPALSPGLDARVYLRQGDRLVSQDARVRAVSRVSRECLLRLRGPAVAAPERAFHRVEAEGFGLQCRLDGEICRVLTLSPGGLGVASRRILRERCVIPIEISTGSCTAAGRVRVVSAQRLPSRETLYGLQLTPAVLSGGGSDLSDLLSQTSMQIQLEARRRQL